MERRKEIPTPYFLYKKNEVQDVINEFQKVSRQGIEIYYAVKANHYPQLIKSVVKAKFGFDVASIHELRHVLESKANPKQIVYAAPAKKVRDIEKAHRLGVRTFMADTEYGVEAIHRGCHGQEYSVILRLQGHGSNAVFDLSDKFGLSNDEAIRILQLSKEKGYKIRGITFHVGSQNMDIDAWDNAFNRISEVLNAFRTYDIPLDLIDLGGGVPAAYDGSVLKRHLYLKVLVQLAKKIRKKFPGIRIAIEPGRVIASGAFSLFTEVVDVKSYKEKPVIIVDTSVFAGLVEAIYKVRYPVRLVRKSNSLMARFVIGGITCDGCDIIYDDATLPSDVKIGDILEIQKAGSYTASWEHVHLLSWPKIVTLKGD